MLALALSFAVSVAHAVYLVWMSPTRDQQWSWQYPIQSLLYLVGPFSLFILVPTAASAILAARWIQRRQRHANTTI
jgi:hypothetical protein